MKELGEAINESLADSDQIAEVVSKIKDGGYDIFLVLEATIGVSKPGEKSPDKTSMVTTLTSNPEFKVSDQDMKLLRWGRGLPHLLLIRLFGDVTHRRIDTVRG